MGRNVFGIESDRDFTAKRVADEAIPDYGPVPVVVEGAAPGEGDGQPVGTIWVDTLSNTAKVATNEEEDAFSPDAITGPAVVPAIALEIEPGEPPSITVFASDFVTSPSSGGYGELSYEASKDSGETWAASVVFLCGDVGSVDVRIRAYDEQGNRGSYAESTALVQDSGLTCEGP